MSTRVGRVIATYALVLASCGAPATPSPASPSVATPAPTTAEQFVARTSPPAAPATPLTTPASATQAATAAPRVTASAAPGILDERYGFLVVRPQEGLVVRSETSDARLASFPGREHRVSVDGRWIAYWHPGEGSTLDRLYIAPTDGGSPTRSLMTVGEGQRGGLLAWSSDGAGLLAAVSSGQLAARNDRSELYTVDIATSAAALLFTTGNGESWLPLGWDRASGVAAAGTIESGFIDDYAVISLTGQRPAIKTRSVRSSEIVFTNVGASSDARFVAGVGRANQVYWWPLADATKIELAQREAHASGLAWRPGTSQLGWIGGPIWSGCTTICGGSELVLMDMSTGGRAVAARIAANLSLRHFRRDGGAAVLGTAGSPDYTVMELATGRTATVADRGLLLDPVRVR